VFIFPLLCKSDNVFSARARGRELCQWEGALAAQTLVMIRILSFHFFSTVVLTLEQRFRGSTGIGGVSGPFVA
jgi:hypothetical protein